MLEIGYAKELVPYHLHGETQHKTLHARLSEDVCTHPEGSSFFRTAPGRFFLKELRHDPTIPEAFKNEYRAPPRRKELRREAMLAVRGMALEGEMNNAGYISIKHLSACLNEGHFAYRHWNELKGSSDYLPVYSFVVVHRAQQVLSFRSGKFKPQSDPLYGSRSIGFGGAVFASDVDLLFDSLFGIIGSGIRELVSGLGLTRRLAEEARYKRLLHSHIATTISAPRDALRHLHVVLSYRCPDEFLPTKNALSLNDLHWVSEYTESNDLEHYDATSRFLFERIGLEQITGTALQTASYG